MHTGFVSRKHSTMADNDVEVKVDEEEPQVEEEDLNVPTKKKMEIVRFRVNHHIHISI